MTDMTVAKTILDQLGGNMFCMMTGCTKRGDRVASDRALVLKIKGAQKTKNGKPTHVKIELNGKDLYDMSFFRIQRGTFDLIETGRDEDIYADMLQSCFTAQTGLYTSMR